MKRLILLRHAKAVPGGSGPDHDRDLSSGGLRDAAWAGTAITATGWAPDAALVSDARRTQHTFAQALPQLTAPPALRIEPRLYDASAEGVLACIAATHDDTACLLVIGHNPGMALTALHFCRAGSAGTRARLMRGFPTAALAMLAIDAPRWRGIASAPARIEAFLTPE